MHLHVCGGFSSEDRSGSRDLQASKRSCPQLQHLFSELRVLEARIPESVFMSIAINLGSVKQICLLKAVAHSGRSLECSHVKEQPQEVQARLCFTPDLCVSDQQ